MTPHQRQEALQRAREQFMAIVGERDVLKQEYEALVQENELLRNELIEARGLIREFAGRGVGAPSGLDGTRRAIPGTADRTRAQSRVHARHAAALACWPWTTNAPRPSFAPAAAFNLTRLPFMTQIGSDPAGGYR